MEQIRLVNVSDKNNNKVYTMTKISNDTFKVEYGRVGAKPQIETYPIYRWNSKYNEKIKKGYIDITNNYSNSSGQFSFNDDNVKEFFSVFSTYVKNPACKLSASGVL